jgi:3-methylfumaryl-CoA hydratase
MTEPSATEPVVTEPIVTEPIVTTELLQAGPVEALAMLFDDGLPVPRVGDPLPPLWHWVALPRWPAAGQTGPDGHPTHAVPAHPPGFPRRMFAGGTVRLLAPLLVGTEVRREVRALSQTRKSGRQGEFMLAAVETRLIGADGRPAVVEVQDIIYRPAVEPGVGAGPGTGDGLLAQAEPAARPLEPGDGGAWRFQTDPRLLLRFSAATANGHRIHYDWPYATQVEGYPGLVVHGPLMTLSLLELARLVAPERPVRTVTHRNQRPLFCGQPARPSWTEAGDELVLTLSTGDTAQAVEHTVVRIT